MNVIENQTVVVGMSGGVDSSVSAAVLKEQGYRVIGLFMKNWEEQDEQGVCQASKEYEDVVRVCEKLAIPYYSVNFVKEYQEQVFAHFLHDYQSGYTPNPDILCNREIKFKTLLEKALALGADYLATGHYCQVGRKENELCLLKGVDINKDQSYFLYTLKASVLSKVLFPVGGIPKAEVRKIAHKYDLSTAEKKDSTGICFIGERNFRQFLSQHLHFQPGNFETLNGKVVGRHLGIGHYTIGQRKGMGLGGPGEAWFVVGKDISRNVIFVEQGTRHPALYSDNLTATELSWVSPLGPPKMPFRCKSKVRYRQPDQECLITSIEGDKVVVEFAVPQRAVTPRQSIVFYDGEICFGGGMIIAAGPSYYELGRSLPDLVSP